VYRLFTVQVLVEL